MLLNPITHITPLIMIKGIIEPSKLGPKNNGTNCDATQITPIIIGIDRKDTIENDFCSKISISL